MLTKTAEVLRLSRSARIPTLCVYLPSFEQQNIKIRIFVGKTNTSWQDTFLWNVSSLAGWHFQIIPKLQSESFPICIAVLMRIYDHYTHVPFPIEVTRAHVVVASKGILNSIYELIFLNQIVDLNFSLLNSSSRKRMVFPLSVCEIISIWQHFIIKQDVTLTLLEVCCRG